MRNALNSGLPRGYLKSCVLLLLREGEAHGYDLLEQLATFGFHQSDPGALYRALRGLEDEGLLSSGWCDSHSGPRKRVYGLTEVGVEELDKLASELAEAERRIDSFLDRYLAARRLPRSNPRRRAVDGRIKAHRASARERERLGPAASPPPR